jgi:hypothetical protein
MPVLTEKQQRRKTNERAAKRIRRSLRAAKAIWPARDPEYLAWLRTQECIYPGCKSKHLHQWTQAGAWTDAAHTGPHGISQKAPDHDAIPLCHHHHQEAKDAQGKRRTWFEDHGLNRAEVIAGLRAKFEQEKS